jgi:hypothetical protein
VTLRTAVPTPSRPARLRRRNNRYDRYQENETKLAGRRGRTLTLSLKSDLMKRRTQFPTAEGDENYEPDQYLPSDDDLLRSGRLAGRAGPNPC